MKNIFNFFAAATISLALFSCSVNKSISTTKMLGESNGVNDKNSDFVQLKNGDYIYFNQLKLSKGFLQAPHLTGDGNFAFYAKDLKAYQINGVYAISQSEFVNGQKSKVCIDALPGFAKRVVTGSLNVYCKKFFNGMAAVNEFYIQQGEKGQIYVYHPVTLKMMIEGKANNALELDHNNLALLDVVASDY